MLVTIKLFVDESGDVGFGGKSTNTFVIGYYLTNKPLRLSCDIKKLRKRLFKQYGLEILEFKFHDDRDDVRFKVLDLIAHSDVTCGYVAVKKEQARQHLKENPSRLYNYLAVHYPIKHVIHTLRPAKIEYVIDKQTWSKKRRDCFNRYLQDKASWTSIVECNSSPSIIEPIHELSHNNPCLQVADYVAGAVFRAAERGDETYFDKIKLKFNRGWQDKWGLEL